MRTVEHVAGRAGASRSASLALAVFILGCAPVANPNPSPVPRRPEPTRSVRDIGAQPSACAQEILPFERVARYPDGLLLSAGPGLRLQRVDAIRLSRPELFHFQRFDPTSMVGILSNGCAAEFWWSRKPGPYEVEEIRILGPAASLDRDHASLQRAPDPEPRWIPTFDGYRHVRSDELSPPGLSYFGLWHRTDGNPGSLVAAYAVDGDPVITLGTTDWTYDGVYTLVPFHDGMYGFMLVDEPDGSEPLYFVTYDWTYRRSPGSGRGSRR